MNRLRTRAQQKASAFAYRARWAHRDVCAKIAYSSSSSASRLFRASIRSSPNSRPTYWSRKIPNFGDILSPILLEAIFGFEPYWVSGAYSGKILGAGSILGGARAGDHVWGSGLIHDRNFDGAGVQFAAVRGPLTYERIRNADVPKIFGDPALLMPLIYTPDTASKRYDVGLVPHTVDQAIVRSDDPSILNIDVSNRSWQETINAIASCDVIVSSSLHGIIVAEAYGRPAVWVQPSTSITGGHFKFRDYYLSTGRDLRPADWSRETLGLTSVASSPGRIDVRALLDSATYLKQQLA